MEMRLVICLSMTVSSLACSIENLCTIKSAQTCRNGVGELVNNTCQQCPQKKFMSSYNLCPDCDDCKECTVNTEETLRCSNIRDTICEGDQMTTTPPPNCTTPPPNSTTQPSTTPTSKGSPEPANKPLACQSSRGDLHTRFYVVLSLLVVFILFTIVMGIVMFIYLWCISSRSGDAMDNGAQRNDKTWREVLHPVADKVFCYKGESPSGEEMIQLSS